MPSYTLKEIERGLGRTPAALETFTIDDLIADLAHAESAAVFVREAVVEPIGARHKALPNPKELFRFLAWKQGSRAAARHEATN